jgi:methylated-DNA-protein-cysteine methyltransferase related protein
MENTSSLPPDPKAFNETVWKIVRLIPSGKIYTYGQIGALIPSPEGVDPSSYEAQRARWVGQAMAQSPADVPWQRVINAQGKISLKKGSDQSLQRRLLETEGVRFDHKERVDLQVFGWEGPADAWLQENGLIPPIKKFQQSTFLF